MIPGTLFFDRHFVFHDGEAGQKILIALGTDLGITVVAKTTSQNRRYGEAVTLACRATHRFPNFVLPQGCCCLSRPTWVCLGEFYEFKDSELLQRHFSGDIRNIGCLSDEIANSLMLCALESEDMSERIAKIVQSALDALQASPQDQE